MQIVVKGMVQVAGTTYRIVRLKRGEYDVFRVLDDVRVGGFSSGPELRIAAREGVNASVMREIARVAIQGAKTSWLGPSVSG